MNEQNKGEAGAEQGGSLFRLSPPSFKKVWDEEAFRILLQLCAVKGVAKVLENLGDLLVEWAEMFSVDEKGRKRVEVAGFLVGGVGFNLRNHEQEFFVCTEKGKLRFLGKRSFSSSSGSDTSQ